MNLGKKERDGMMEKLKKFNEDVKTKKEKFKKHVYKGNDEKYEASKSESSHKSHQSLEFLKNSGFKRPKTSFYKYYEAEKYDDILN